MSYENELSALIELKKFFICFLCKHDIKEAVQVETCGHFFCVECLEKNKKSNLCPQCNEVYVYPEDLNYKTHHSYGEIKEQYDSILKFLEEAKSQRKFIVNFVDWTNVKRNKKGETALHLACHRKDLAKVRQLIVEEKTDINYKDYAGWAPLHEAIQVESVEIVQELLERGALVDIPGQDYVTPLHKAVVLGNVEISKLLIKYGASLRCLDYDGRKPEDCTEDPEFKKILQTELKPSEIVEVIPQVYVDRKVVVYCHLIDEKYKKRLKQCKIAKVKNEFDIRKGDLTHLVVKKEQKMSTVILHAMLEGLIIVTQEWVDDLEKGKLNIPANFMFDSVLHDYPFANIGFKAAMFNKLFKKPKLLDGISFFIDGHDKEVEIFGMNFSKESLKRLVTIGGGTCLYRSPAPRTLSEADNTFPFHARYVPEMCVTNNIIIFDENQPPTLRYNMPELKHMSSKWLIVSIVAFSLDHF